MTSDAGNDGIDIAAVWDEHMRCEFELRDADATMQTMTDSPCLVEVPAGTGAQGREAVRNFYRDHFIPSWPEGTEVSPVSRTVGTDRVVDEFVVRFTHSLPMDWWLPRVAPTGRRVALPHVAIVGFERGLIAYEHIYWDQGSLLAQVGLLDGSAVPVLGSDQAEVLVRHEPRAVAGG
jgi:carboxymethylenebutenolidase